MRVNEFTVSVTYIGAGQPMVTIIGGQHGDESIGVATVEQVLSLLSNYDVDGKIAVIPDCNPLAHGSREYNGIDLNRQHGQEVTDPYLQKIIETVDKLVDDSVFVIDCHSSHDLDEPCIVVNKQAENYSNCFNIETVNRNTESPHGSLRNYCEFKDVPLVTTEAIENNIDTAIPAAEGILEILRTLGVIKLLSSM